MKQYAVVICIMIFGAVTVLFSQDKKLVEKKQTTSPALMIQGENGEQKPLHLRKLSISAEVVGNFAVTTIDMTFYNDLDKVLEGELVFPLGEGQTVSRFAMELGGTLREGVVVEKAQGRKVFEAIVRRRVDPALLEMTVGNTFRSRVYPIPAKGTKRVVMAYEQELRRTDEGQLFTLPMEYSDPVDTFVLHTELKNIDKAPDLRKNVFESIRFEKLNKNFVADFSANNFTANRPLTVLMPAGIENAMKVFTGKRDGDTYTYFYINGLPEAEERQKTLPKNIVIMWDNSGSSAQNDKTKILDALTEYLKKCGNCSVRLFEFALKPIELGTFSITNGNTEQLRKKIELLVPDGATRLHSLNFKNYTADEIILITDGVQTFDKGDIVIGKSPITILNANQIAEHGFLKRTALSTRGQYINCAAMQPDEIVKQMTQLPLQFIGAKTSGNAETYPALVQPIRGDFSVAGRSADKQLTVTLQFGFGNTVVYEKNVEISADNSVQSSTTPRLWAQKKLTELDMEFEKNKKAITDLGKEFSIVTKTTSLIVLEQISDYVQYRIVPPTEELKKEYYRLVQLEDNNKKVQDDNRIETIVGMAKRRMEWYDDFNKQIENDRNERNRYVPVRTQPNPDTAQRTFKRSVYGTIEGKVFGIKGKPLVGATIRLLGTKRGANSKADGSFKVIKVDKNSYTLEASYVGYESQKQSISVDSGVTATVTFKLKSKLNADSTVIINTDRHKESLSQEQKGKVRERNGEDNTKIAVESVQIAVPISSGVQQGDDGFIVRGSRSESTQIRVDGLDIGDQFQGSFSGNGTRTAASVSNFGVEEMYAQDRNFTAEARDNGWDNGFNPPQTVVLEPSRPTYVGGGTFTPSTKKPEVYYPDFRKICEDSLQNVDIREYYPAYLRLRRLYSSNPAFYAEAADIFMEKGQKENALRVISNLAELKIESQRLLRILGRRLLKYGFNDEAVYVFREVRSIREEEPQSMRDLGLALAAGGKYQEAVDTLYAMALRKWDSRFPEVESIALNEMNAVINKAGNSVQTKAIDTRLLYNHPMDLRIVLDWDADNSDIDLWVIDPNGEKCFYSHPNTKIGGKLSRDLTGGYGPEEFTLKNAIPGKYEIKVHYYGDRQQSIAGPTTINVQIFTDYGKATEKKRDISMRMKSTQEVVDIGEVVIEKK